MKTTPAAWMHEDGSVITAEKKTKAEQSSSIQAAMVSGYATPLHAIPDTHRVVSVELLEKCVGQLLYGAKAHQGLNDEVGNPSRIAPGRIACETLSDELSAIIEDKP